MEMANAPFAHIWNDRRNLFFACNGVSLMNVVKWFRNRIIARKEQKQQLIRDMQIIAFRQSFDACDDKTAALQEIMSIIATQTTPQQIKAIMKWLVDLNFHFEHQKGRVDAERG
jgi:hypothetical protein